jgi:hypothetical protein
VLRGLHLVAVIGLGAAIMGAPMSLQQLSIAVLFTGLAMFALELWNKPRILFEWSGASLIIKLGLIAVMALNAELRLPLFWLVVVWSAIFSHAPSSFRHKVWWR